jgi:SET domain-containing protein
MIPSRYHRDTRSQEINGNPSGYPPSGRRILTVDDDEMNSPSQFELRHHFDHRFPPRFSNNVAEE